MYPQRTDSAHSPDYQHGLATILLVDDVNMLRELAKTILKNAGYTVLDAKDGETALKIAEEYPGPIHVLLTDMFMPVSGCILARASTLARFASAWTRENLGLFWHC